MVTPIKTAMISQPMADRTEEEITTAREKAKAFLEGKGYKFVNTLFTDERYKLENMVDEGVVNIPLYYFANSVLNMSKCNVAYFCKGWEDARGCRLEHDIAEAYGVEIIEEE